ncbi:MAG TPA: HIT domain-containing protein [Rhodanobacteraceae bacterium]|jgi:diadenosine tetraphosphate (Ap4A) HIT family hydrolase|nr:HIT domain-containing protein [Rhodanobacteraceae bacterium]
MSRDADFELDPRLAGDTAFVADWPLCRVLLMDDARYPWLLLVPRRRGAVELDDLRESERMQLMHEIQRAMDALRGVAEFDKLNVGALGNIVRQLHVHVLARSKDDDAWPGPVWGHGSARRYPADARDALVTRFRSAS